MKLVSIIIPTKNSAAYLERCLESIKAQTYPEIEIIVVDNHSSDATREISARFGTVIRGESERSAQFNQGAKHAHGDYFYRVDGDFELEPGVVEACVAAIEKEGADILAVPNRSAGGSYWARVRQLERETYLDDDLIVAARFWRREAFEAVGGFDESLVSCEDYDLHNRMIKGGFKLGRIKPCEIHLGESDSLWEHTKKSFYYGPSAWRYMRKHPDQGVKQMFPLRVSYWRHRRELFKHPRELLGLILLKKAQYGAAGLAILLSWFGLLDDTGRFSSASFGGLIILLASMVALLNVLPRYGVRAGRGFSFALILIGLLSWLWVGKRWAKQRNEPFSATLLTVSLSYTPYLLVFIFGNYLSQETWLFMFSILTAIVIAWLVYLSDLGSGSHGWASWMFTVVIAVFTGFFTFRLAGQLQLRNIIAHEIIYFDQALWTTANGISSGGQLLNNTILVKSVFSEVAAPVLLLFLPLYKIGLGGPFLLLASQIVFIGLIAIALYRLGERRLGKGASFFLVCAYLVYYLTPRLLGHNFQPETLGVAALILGLDALERKRPGLYFLWIIFAVTCGEKVAIALAVLGVVVFFREKDRWTGIISVLIGVISAWILMFVFPPYFGGLPFRLPGLDEFAEPGFLVQMLTQPEVLNYLIILLAPLAFLPLLGMLWLLPAIPLVFLNILFRRINTTGPSEAVISAFLFVAVIFGLAWAVRNMSANRRQAVQLSGAVFVFVACLLSARFLNSNFVEGLWQLPYPSGPTRGQHVLAQVPAEASLATQSSLALSLAHRAQLYLLPKVEEAEYILVDLFASAEAPQLEIYELVVQRVFNNPDYGLRDESDGLLLFERGLDISQDFDKLARAEASEIEYPSEVVLADTIAYRGYSLEDASPVPGQPFVITTYWESLATVERPYLFFFAYPGSQQFQEAVYGLYPTAIWQPGDLVRQRFMITLPTLPAGEDYEVVAGLWFDTGETILRQPSQLLGEDVVRIAKIKVTDRQIQLQPWRGEGGN